MTMLSAALKISAGWGEKATLLACKTPKGKVTTADFAARTRPVSVATST